MKIDAKDRVKLMGQLNQIVEAFPDEERLDQYPCWGTRIPESALEIQVLLRQCQYKFEKQGVLDTITIGMIQKRINEIEHELDGTISRSPGEEKHNSDYHYRYDLLKGLDSLFPLADWKQFYSEIESLSPTVRNN
jgi:hypothetical protein